MELSIEEKEELLEYVNGVLDRVGHDRVAAAKVVAEEYKEVPVVSRAIRVERDLFNLCYNIVISNVTKSTYKATRSFENAGETPLSTWSESKR